MPQPSPSPVSSPAAPSHPPAPPGHSYTHVVTTTLSIDGTIEAFDQTAFKERLVNLFTGLSTANVRLVVAAGSVSVTAIIQCATSVLAQSIVGHLNAASLSELSNSLGVSVTTKGVASRTLSLSDTSQVLEPTSPAPSSARPEGLVEFDNPASALKDRQSSGSATAVVAGSAVGGGCAAVLVIALVIFYFVKRLRSAQDNTYPGAAPTGGVSLARAQFSPKSPKSPKSPGSPRTGEYAGLDHFSVQLHNQLSGGEGNPEHADPDERTAASEQDSEDTINEIIRSSTGNVVIAVPAAPQSSP